MGQDPHAVAAFAAFYCRYAESWGNEYNNAHLLHFHSQMRKDKISDPFSDCHSYQTSRAEYYPDLPIWFRRDQNV